MPRLRGICLVSILLLGHTARAEPIVLRMAAIAPDGTDWARELKGFARQVEAGTHGDVKVKWYLGGIAGDEMEGIDRIRRDQLDGTAGAGFCTQLSPSLRVLRVAGLLRSRDEALHVLNSLHAEAISEFRKNGFVYLGGAGFGMDLLFSRAPVRSLADLRRGNVWIRPFDEVIKSQLEGLGAHMVVLHHGEVAKAYEEGKLDILVAPPSSAMAFQWTGLAHAFTDYKLAFLLGCLAIATRAFDKLPLEYQKEIQTQAAVLASRFEYVGRAFDAKTLEVIQAKGVTRIAPSPAFRAELEAALKAARAKIDPALIPPALIDRVEGILARFRAETH